MALGVTVLFCPGVSQMAQSSDHEERRPTEGREEQGPASLGAPRGRRDAAALSSCSETRDSVMASM